MSVIDEEIFEESMNEEMVKCFDNAIYEIVKCSSIFELKIILKAVCSHWRKQLLMVKFVVTDQASVLMTILRNMV